MSEKRTSQPLPELSEQDAELLSAYIDDMLQIDERAKLESRLEDNAFLREELATMQQTIAWVNQLPRLKAPRNFTITAEDLQRARSQEQPKKVLRPNFGWTLAASAAAIILVIFGVLIVMRPMVGDVFSDLVSALEGGAPSAMQAEEVAIMTTSEQNDDTASLEMEQRASFPTETPVPIQTIVGIGAVQNTQANRDEAEKSTETDRAVANAAEDILMLSPTQEMDLQMTQQSELQSLKLLDAQQTATAIAMIFNTTPTMEFVGENDQTTTLSLSDGGDTQESADSALAAGSSLAEAPAQVPADNYSYLPESGGGLALEAIGRKLLAWLIALVLEFLQ